MVIDDALADFVEGAVMIIVGTAAADGVPGIARAVSARADRADGRLDLLVSAWQWPEAVAAITATRRIAVTFARPADYVSLQVKGLVEAIRPATPDEGKQARTYITDMTATLAALGLDTELAEPWQSDRALMALSVRPDAVFVQTPGVQAGQVRS